MRKHGWTPRGLDAAGKQKVRGPAPSASPQFGSRFGRFFERSEIKFSEDALRALAEQMIAKPDDPKDGLDAEESGIPALYTYFGQFIDHDLTFDPEPDFQRFKDQEAVVDFRTAAFDLDNVYGRGKDDQPFMYDGDKFLLGAPIVHGSPNPDEARDLPRNSVGRALIGDPRNDENSIVSQLQGSFLRAHNRAVDAVNGAIRRRQDDRHIPDSSADGARPLSICRRQRFPAEDRIGLGAFETQDGRPLGSEEIQIVQRQGI